MGSDNVFDEIPKIYGTIHRIREVVMKQLPMDAIFTIGVKEKQPMVVWTRAESLGAFYEICVQTPLVSSFNTNYWEDCGKKLRDGLERVLVVAKNGK